MSTPDPDPWQHVSGQRLADPYAPGSPTGGYTYAPRHGYADHPDRYRSTWNPDPCRRCRMQ